MLTQQSFAGVKDLYLRINRQPHGRRSLIWRGYPARMRCRKDHWRLVGLFVFHSIAIPLRRISRLYASIANDPHR